MLILILIVGCCGVAWGADSTTVPPPDTTTVAPTAAPTAAPTTTGAAAASTTGMHVPASTAAAAPGTTAGMAALAAAAATAAPAAAAAAAAPAPAPAAPPAASLVTLYSFKNNQYSTHAYCSTDDCMATVKGRGFKSDKQPRGKVVAPTDAALKAAQTACPGVEFLPLGFPKKRQGYVHNLEGAGLQVGYVVTTAGECSATVGLKQYKKPTSDDILYSRTKGGKPVFYLWE